MVTSPTTDGDRPLAHEPLGELFRDAKARFGRLAAEESNLAKAEMAEKKRAATAAATLGGVALVLALCAIGALVATAILALDLVMPAWAAALIVGVVLVIAAAAAGMAARARLRAVGSPLPQRTIESVKEDVGWLSSRVRSGLA
jgi:uncharacterized membrane protein YqjE